MLANLPVEIILLICEYPESKELKQLARTNKRMMRIIKKYLPKALERKILLYLVYPNDKICEGRICLFDSYTNSVEQIARFTSYYYLYEVATTQNKMLAINYYEESSEIYYLNTRQISRGPDPPEWRAHASVAYFKNKLYYLGGDDAKTWDMNLADVLTDGKWQTGPALPLPIRCAQTTTCDEILYVIDGWGWGSRKIYRLSDDEREWIEIGEIPEKRNHFGVASLNGRIYITGGLESDYGSYGDVLKSCMCFDLSAPVDSQISRIADMNHARYRHSLIVANRKLYAIGGYQESLYENFCNSIEEYDPQTNEWREVGEVEYKI